MKKFLALFAILALLPTAALAHTEESPDQDNAEVNYIMFVHEDCPHCQLVEAFAEQNDLDHHITYVELKNNDANMDLLEEKWEVLEIEGGIGWPMMIVDEDSKLYEIGDTPIISYLAEQFDVDYDGDTELSGSGSPSSTGTDTSGGDTLFFVVGAVIVLGIVAYGISSVVSDKK